MKPLHDPKQTISPAPLVPEVGGRCSVDTALESTRQPQAIFGKAHLIAGLLPDKRQT